VKNKGRLTTPFGSLISVDQPNIIIQAVWLDADGKPVARLREIAGKATDARLSSAVFLGVMPPPPGAALERGEVGSISVSLKPFEIRTVRVTTVKKGREDPSDLRKRMIVSDIHQFP
jgi:alpha-mannosidase